MQLLYCIFPVVVTVHTHAASYPSNTDHAARSQHYHRPRYLRKGRGAPLEGKFLAHFHSSMLQ